MGLLLALDRRIPDNVAELRAGRWNKKEFSKAQGLFGRTLGLLGSGPIACEVARRAAAFGMSLLIWSRRFNGADRAMTAGEMGLLGLELQPRQPLVMLGPTPEAVAARADALSVHLALSKETRGLVGVSVFAQMKRGALFLNTSRGEIVDPSALDAAVR